MLAQENRVKRRIADGGVAAGLVCRALSPAVVEVIGLAGLDFVWIDMEHSSADFTVVESLCRAADATSITALVRVPDKNPSSILRALEAGAGIVNVPQIEERAEAEAVVRAAKYHPVGERGFSASSRGTAYGFGGTVAEIFAAANDRVMTMVQIESARGVENAREICSVAALDVVFVGLGDLSQSLGYTDNPDHPEVVAAVDQVLRAVADSGKIASVIAESPDSWRRWLDAGVGMMCYGVDLAYLGRVLQQRGEELRALRREIG